MNEPYTFFQEKKRIVVVSLFSGVDIFMFSLLKSGMLPGYGIEKILKLNRWHSELYKHPDGTPVMEPYVAATKEEYDYRKNHSDARGRKDMEDEVGIIDGQYVRTKLVQEINGRDIRASLEMRYGKDIVIVVIGGPPCQGYTKLNTENNKFDNDLRNYLVFQYLRILKEVSEGGLTLGLMEEVMDFGQGKFKELYEDFLKEAEKLPFQLGEQEMCSLHYGGHQNRWRRVFQFIPEELERVPLWPKADDKNIKRVKDFLDIDYFVMGGFDQLMRSNEHFMQTVTRGTPLHFFKDGVKRDPTTDELFLCQGVKKGELPIPAYIPRDLQRLAIGNGVCAEIGNALGKTLIEDVLKVKHIGDGYFISLDSDSDGPDGAGGNYMLQPALMQVELKEQSSNNDMPLLNENNIEGVTFSGTNIEIASTVELSKEKTKQEPAGTQQADNSSLFPSSLGGGQNGWFGVSGISGITIWRGPSLLNGEEVVAILTLRSSNEKTGNMAQLWILPAGMEPLEAVKSGYDKSICGNCSLRPNGNGGCYVEVAKAPSKVWEAWRNGAYPEWPLEHFNALGRYAIRYGAYGDPAAIPAYILSELKKYVTNYTAYTHQWRNAAAQDLKPLCMASVESVAQQQEAAAMGWRTFRIINKGDELLKDEILCPELTNGVKCEKCQLCKGTSRKAKNIAIYAHGALKSRFKDRPLAATAFNKSVIKERVQTDKQGIAATNPIRVPRIISSQELAEMQFSSLNLDGRWGEFLGQPETNFHLLIYGLPGGGKSTMAVQLAVYLAENFGKAIYISGEEGFAMSFQHKFLNNGAITPGLDVADIRNYDELISIVPRNAYKFIFIDSLNTMKIDAIKLRKIKLRYPDAAVITICQSTKQGALRGSQELAHDSDIIVVVESGMGTTEKNRFNETGMGYHVFAKNDD